MNNSVDLVDPFIVATFRPWQGWAHINNRQFGLGGCPFPWLARSLLYLKFNDVWLFCWRNFPFLQRKVEEEKTALFEIRLKWEWVICECLLIDWSEWPHLESGKCDKDQEVNSKMKKMRTFLYFHDNNIDKYGMKKIVPFPIRRVTKLTMTHHCSWKVTSGRWSSDHRKLMNFVQIFNSYMECET